MHGKLASLSIAAVLGLALVLAGGGDAQQPGKKGPKKGPKGGFGAVTADQIVERILSFDKDSDGKVVADELPERMQHLIAMGDVNKDGALDKEEIRKLADTIESFVGLATAVGPGGPKGKGDGFKGGKGGLKGVGLRGGIDIQTTLDELNLKGGTLLQADRLLRAHQGKLRKMEEVSRAELVLQMKDVLNEDDYRVFKSAVERPLPPVFGQPQTPELSKQIDQLQKDLGDLRGKLAK